MSKIIKKSFTLIEILVVFFIISSVFSVLGFYLNKAIYIHKQKNNIKKIKSYLDFAQKMAVLHQSDVIVKFTQDKKDVKLFIGLDENLGFFCDKPQKDIFENLKIFFNKKPTNFIEILCTSNGVIWPQGKLTFYNSKYDLENDIDL